MSLSVAEPETTRAGGYWLPADHIPASEQLVLPPQRCSLLLAPFPIAVEIVLHVCLFNDMI